MVGFGYDIHRLAFGEELILGGIKIPSELGTVAHSDGDVLVHAIIDALLGASSLGDIGEYFPDNDIKYKDINSCSLLREVKLMIDNKNLQIVNIDTTIVLERPKLLAFKQEIKKNLASILELQENQVSIKATTNEKLGELGNNEGIVVFAICELKAKEF